MHNNEINMFKLILSQKYGFSLKNCILKNFLLALACFLLARACSGNYRASKLIKIACSFLAQSKIAFEIIFGANNFLKLLALALLCSCLLRACLLS